MTENTEASQILLVSGFLGAIGLAALVLILQTPKPFERPMWFLSGHQFFALIVSLLALMVVLATFASLTGVDLAAGIYKPESAMDMLNVYTFFGAFLVLMIVLPLILLPLTPLGAGLVVAGEVVLFGVFVVADSRSPRA